MRAYLTQALADALFDAFVRGLVVAAIFQIVGQALHVSDFAFEIVGILVALPVTEILHKSGRGVAKVQRHRLGNGTLDILSDVGVGGI